MCTVSFVCVDNSVIITSNRDENIQRQNAAAPAFHQLNNKKIIFPKDAKAGGTWFAACSNGTVIVLLNGAFIKHIPAPAYRKSRGLILLDIIAADEPGIYFKQVCLENIEPFTAVLFQQGSLHELRWDGDKKHDKPLNIRGNYIWSSSTLYTTTIIERREKLFAQFISNGVNKTPGLVHDLHRSDDGDPGNGFIINGETGMKTFSITQAVIRPGNLHFLHDDLLHGKRYEESIDIPETSNNIIREEI